MSNISATLIPDGQTKNHEGFSAFVHSIRDRARNYLRTGTLSGTFYVSAEELGQECIATLHQFGQQDAHALAEETIGAREEGYMRTLPIVALVVLSTLEDKQLFYDTAKRVLKIPRDVLQFIEICKSGAVPGRKSFGGCAIRPVREFLEQISEYHAVKYGFSHRTNSMSLRDAVRLAHPRSEHAEQEELLGWLSGHIKGQFVQSNARVKAFEGLKRTQDPSEIVRLVREGQLPFEAVTAVVSSPTLEVWEALLRHAPTFNLLRNLQTFTRHGVFAKDENVELAVKCLTRPDALRQARILPFRVYQAWKVYSASESADLRIVAALSDALDASAESLPFFTKRVAIAPDVSGSMRTPIISHASHAGGSARSNDLLCSEVAGLFASGLLRRCPNVTVLPFEQAVISVSLNPRDSVLTNAQTIGSLGGGGTSLCAPVELLLKKQDRVDLFVGITDNEEWVGRGFLGAWREYREKVSPEAKAVLITVVPTDHRVVPESESGVHYVHGWSDQVLRYVADIAGVSTSNMDVD